MLQLKNIVKNYYVGETTVEALRGLSVDFRKNEFVAVLGPSGCGKTTLLNIVGGLDRYTSGDLIVSDRSTKNYTDYDWDSYRNHSIGFVFQNYNLIPHQSVLKNVELALTLSGVSRVERKRRAIEALDKVGLKDQIYKKPNQLSGGQQQRVAIARSLVNDPEILLADEPTGALDTTTSAPIMNILKEISKTRLVIMVTHNFAIAEKYASRVIKLLDGKIVDDSKPYTSAPRETEKNPVRLKKNNKTSMSFFTALSLSLNNLFTKKTRTILTAFAGSIGIIGIALVLALSNGFQSYIDKMQGDTLASYPIEINENDLDISSFSHRPMKNDLEKYPSVNKIFVNKIDEIMDNIRITNNITDEYINDVIKTIDPSLYNGISYLNSVNLNVYKETDGASGKEYQSIRVSSDMGMMSIGIWQELINNDNFLQSQYDILAGDFPKQKNELVIVVDKYNQITDRTLKELGLYKNEADAYMFDEILGTKYRLILNDDYYRFNGSKFDINDMTSGIYEKGLELEIVGIVRLNSQTDAGVITGAVGYLSALTDYVLADSLGSEIVIWQKDHPETNALTGMPFLDSQLLGSAKEQYDGVIKKLGGKTQPYKIRIFPVDIKAKEKIKEHLDAYNAGLANDADKVFYTDLVEIVINSINTIIDIISYVLIAFTAISLFVSSIMIGIITYISVLERTKEIGILRSIGARKKDISRLFNAETVIIGFTAGLMGVLITLVLTIPINIIIYNLSEISNISVLSPVHAVFLVVISMALTLIAGFIPSRIAAGRDPVIALRTE